MYKLFIDVHGKQNLVMKLSDNLLIPFDPANVDYQEYQRWLAEGNIPEPADEIQQG